jgi:anti-anti-sigma factor
VIARIFRGDDRMELRTRRIGDVTVLEVAGELTPATAPGFLRRARLLLAGLARPAVAIDLSAVRRVDSSGFAALVALARHVERLEGDVCLVGLGAEMRLLLELMQLHLLFDVCDDVPGAIELLSAGRLAPPPAALPSPRRVLGRIRVGSGDLQRRAAG